MDSLCLTYQPPGAVDQGFCIFFPFGSKMLPNRSQSEPEISARLHALLVEWRRSVEAKIPQPNPQWQPRDDR